MSKENIKNFVDSLQKGDNLSAADAFKSSIADKVSSALDNAKVDVAKSVFTGQQGVDTPEANPFSGNDAAAETPAPEVTGDENAQ
jgi:hypothetical protein